MAPCGGAAAALAVLAVLATAFVELTVQFDFSKDNFEAAFQGRCGRESPCEQLCFELHDGMFECECRDGFVLHVNGYGCLVTPPAQYSDPDEYDDEDDEEEGEDDAHATGTPPPPPPPPHEDDHHNEVPDGEDVLYQQGAVMTASLQQDNGTDREPVNAASHYEVSMDVVLADGGHVDNSVHSYVIVDAPPTRMPPSTSAAPAAAAGPTTTPPPKVQFVPAGGGLGDAAAAEPQDADGCPLDCGPGGACITETVDTEDGERRPQRCQCPLGRGGSACQADVTLRCPRFPGRGWLAFPALRAAYKRVSIHLEFRPEAWDGVLLLAGERDDLTGDYLAVVISKGFVEFRFDCGSGQGVVRSDETVLLNQWNRLSVHRHRWDASVRLNGGRRVAGRSKGLFSRITFREPLFLGGPGNTTGLAGKLPPGAGVGLRGCVRHLEVNDQVYDFSEDAMQGFDVEECIADQCSALPCQHGGRCTTGADGSAACQCPLGYAGELCETRVELLVPAFNGSSFLRYPGLGDSALSWLDLRLTIKPAAASGLLLYNGHRADGVGDFMALYMVDGHIEFSFDLGSGPGTVRSSRPLALGEWHEVRVTRAGRTAALQVDGRAPDQVSAAGAFLHMSLPLSLYLGGVPSFHAVSGKVRVGVGNFVGCVQRVVVNERPLRLLAAALAGLNVDNCPHPCAAGPCGPGGRCVPRHDTFSCLCPAAAAGQSPAPTAAGTGCGPAAPRAAPAADAIVNNVHGVRGKGRPRGHRGDRGGLALSAGFVGTSYMHFTDMETVRRASSDSTRINMRMRSTASSGLVLWMGRHPEEDDGEVQAVHQRHGVHPSFGHDFLAVGIQDGLVHLRVDLGSGELFLGYNLTRVNDGQWHRVNVVRRGQEATISVDNGPALGRTAPGRLRQLNTNTGLYIGGVPDAARLTRGRYSVGVDGCLADVTLGEDLAYHVPLDDPQQAENVAACGAT